MKRARLKDIAEITGFSIVTVQRAIASPKLVAEKTRSRILQVMKEVGYVPDRNAASLVTNSSGFLGLIVSSAISPTFADEIDSIANFGLSTGLEILLAQTSYDPEREHPALQAMLGRRPNGMIITFSPSDPATRKMVKKANIPVVEIWDTPSEPIDMVVGFSNERAARQVVEHFQSKGRQRPAFFGQRLGRDEKRWRAFSEACVELLGREAVHVPVGSGESIMEESFHEGAAFFKAVEELDVGIDCVFCTSDVTAAGVIFEAQRRGVDIPGDLSVCGFGDLPFARSLFPRLTTVGIPSAEIGRRACELILARLSRLPCEDYVVLDTHLIVRESS